MVKIMASIVVIGADITKDAHEETYQTQDGKNSWFFAVNVAEDKGLSKEKKEEAKAEGKPTANYYSFSITTFSEAQANYYRNLLKKGNHVAFIGEYDGISDAYQSKDGKYVSGSLRVKIEPLRGGKLDIRAKGGIGNDVAQAPKPAQAPTPTPTPAPNNPAPNPEPTDNTSYQAGGKMPWDE